MFYILQLYKENFMKIFPCLMGLRPFSCFARSTEVLLSLRSVFLYSAFLLSAIVQGKFYENILVYGASLIELFALWAAVRRPLSPFQGSSTVNCQFSTPQLLNSLTP